MADADYSVLLTRDGEGLHAYVSGQRSLTSTHGYWDDILDHVRSWSPRWLFLCDELSGQELSAGEWRELFTTRLGRGLEGMCLAHVKPGGHGDEAHCERFAREAGLEARAFADVDVATHWLRDAVGSGAALGSQQTA